MVIPMTSPSSSASTWALRAHAACEWVWWAFVLNVLWAVFALAGGVVLGAAPATVAATTLTRRRLRHERFPVVRSFVKAWRTDLVRANLVVGPPMLAAALLGLQVAAVTVAGSFGSASSIAAAGAFAFAFALAAIVTVMYTHYELPLGAYLPTASRWMLRNLAPALLLLVAATGVVIATVLVPGLLPLLTIGAWLSIATALCVAFFTANDRLVSEQPT